MQVVPLDSKIGDNFLSPSEQVSELSCDMNSQPSKKEFRIQLAPKLILRISQKTNLQILQHSVVTNVDRSSPRTAMIKKYPEGIGAGYLSNLASTRHGWPAQCPTYGKEIKLGTKATATSPFLIHPRGPYPEFHPGRHPSSGTSFLIH